MSLQLAGIIPVAGQPLDFKMPWHDALMPLAPDYLMVERSILECAYAGCKTIWVVCNDDVQPLIRHKLGESIQDPVYVNRSYEKNRREHKRPIRIYYVPINAKDVNKRDCLGWSVIHGAETIKKISSAISTWVVPQKFYVSWPYGYYDPAVLRSKREVLSSAKNLYLTTDGQGVSLGKYTGFTFNLATLRKLKDEVYLKSTGLWAEEGLNKKLPLRERFSYRSFTLSDVFNSLDLKEYEMFDLPDYHHIDNWHDYCKFLSSGEKVARPHEIILNYKEWNEIGLDD